MFVLSNSVLFFILFSCFILLHTPYIKADGVLQDDEELLKLCSTTEGTYTSGSQYQSNLNVLLSVLVSNGTRDGFFNSSIGTAPDIVYGLVQCRGDLSMQECGSCLRNLSVNVIQECPNQKEARLQHVKCMLRYSDNNFFSTVDISWTWSAAFLNISDADGDRLEQQLEILLKNLSNLAAPELHRYKSGNIAYKPSTDIYGMVQCTRDLSPSQCLACLQAMSGLLPRCCVKKNSAHIFCPSCYIRYDVSPFLEVHSQSPSSLPLPPVPLSPPANNENRTDMLNGVGSGKSTNIVVIIVPVIASVLLITICAYFILRRISKRLRKENPEPSYSEDDIIGEESLQFDLSTIRASTDNFCDSNKLGEGGFGAVYKGELIDGREIAVKRLSKNSGQGSQEFKNEVVVLHKLQHRNLVRLLGYCLGEEEKLLIYEYIPNRSLDKYIFDSTKEMSLSWENRCNIIQGIARGLLYLHEDSRLRIIHRDLKSGNILLDAEMIPKIADFGMAKLFGVDQSQGNTSRVAGTFGYMAPEYVFHGIFSVKSDVYSFGILLLEIVSGQSTSKFNHSGSSRSLVSYAWQLWKEGNALQLIDSNIIQNVSASEATRFIHIALLCVQDNAEVRPTMSSVVVMLSSYSVTLETPSTPAFILESMTPENDNSAELLYSEDGAVVPR